MPIPLMKDLLGRKVSQLDSIQVMRALAALAVCVGHALHEALHFGSTPDLLMLDGLPWGSGVDLFFIISGFIMMHTSAKAFGTPGAARTFMVRRLLRIVPPYWFFTTLMVIVSIVLASQLDTTVFTPMHAVLSYLFIPHIEPDGSGIHPLLGLGWTLVYEMFFYIAFSIALLWQRKTGLLLLVGTFVVLFMAGRAGVFPAAWNAFFGDTVIFGFLSGILIYLMRDAQGRLTRMAGVSLIGFALSVMAMAYAGGFLHERIFGQGMVALMVFVLLYPLKADKWGIVAALVLVGDASYTLYLSHPFVLEVVKQVMMRLPGAVHASPATVPLYVAVCLLVATVGAVVFYLLCEKPVTGLLQRRILGKTPQVAIKTDRKP